MRTKLISHSIQLLLFISVASWSSYSVADGIVKGKVEFVRTHNGTTSPQWAPPTFWFSLKGVTSAGSCKTWVGGKVLFAAKTAQDLNLVMVAIQSNKEIAVDFNESDLVDGWCTAHYITIGNPIAPLY